LLRDHPDYIPELAFVAEIEGKIVGSITYTKSSVSQSSSGCLEVVSTCTFGPVSVDPEYQRRGVCRQLIAHTLAVAAGLGYPAAIIFGNPDFYGKLGFRCGERYDITTESGYWSVALMLYVLDKAVMDRILAAGGGKFVESSAFRDFTGEGLDAFDASFQAKQPLVKQEDTESQRRFKVVSSLKYKQGDQLW